MTLALVKKEVVRFLQDEDPEVLAVRGKWGVGKTYSWNRFLEQSNRDAGVSRDKYSYLSLFGIGSLDALKWSLFTNTIDRTLIGVEPSMESLRDNTARLSESVGRKFLKIAQSTSFMKGLAPAVDALSFFSVRDSLICLDDLERRSESLSGRDILGLVSLLKEQRNCKIVLLLNDGEEGLEDFEKYREKVVDIELLFEPTAEECASIALEGLSEPYFLVAELSQKLNITNIRTLKKIERLVGLIKPRLQELEDEVVYQVIHSLVLYAWCHYRANDQGVPTLEYVENVGYFLYGIGEDMDVTEQEQAWNTRLQEYGYGATDELDRVLISAVKTGYVQGQEFLETTKKKNEEAKASKATGSFSQAWRKYHDTFQDNQEEVIETLYESFRTNVKYISPVNLDGTVRLFRELGETEKADEIIEIYVDERRTEPNLFNLRDNPFSGDIKDDSVRDAFQAAFTDDAKQEPVRSVLLRLIGANSWSGADEAVLAAMNADEFYELFKAEEGEHLSRMVNTCLKFGQFQNASDRQRQIAENTKEALRRIGQESKINARRVRQYGIKDEDGA